MFLNYFKVAIRNLSRQKGFSFINIFGLALGISCTALIGMWIIDELSYDQFHQNQKNIYRIVSSIPKMQAAVTSAPMANTFRNEIPEIEAVVRIRESDGDVIHVNDLHVEEKRMLYADSNFFSFFDFAFVKGNKETALLNPDGIVITEGMALKYFGTADVLDKLIGIGSPVEYLKVTGVIANVPENSHLQFDFVQPLQYLARTYTSLLHNVWDDFNLYTYIRLNDKVQSHEAMAVIENKMKDIYTKNEPNMKVSFLLQPLTAIHLHSNFLMDVGGNGSIQNVRILSLVALFILIVACLNFMNLATARAMRRAKEVGMRKVVGAIRYQLVGQFLAESIVVALLALVVAIFAIYLVLPSFNTLSGKNLALDFSNINLLSGLLGITVITGLLAGSYPALYLSGFVPAQVLKGTLKMGSSTLFRNTMVVIQFMVSIALIVGTTVVYRQLNYIQHLNLGYDKENLLYVRMTGDMWTRYETLRNSLRSNRFTNNFSFVSDLPTTTMNATMGVNWSGKDPNSQPLFFNLEIDENFSDVFKPTFLEGHGYTENALADSMSIIVNETALETMDIKRESAVGTRITRSNHERIIIGVVKDFNFKPVQEAIGPMLLERNTSGGYAIIRTLPNETENAIKALEQICHEINPNYPFEFSFLDQDIANLYIAEKRLGKLFTVFAVLALAISCLGLYGLSAYLAERRMREMSIRKVLGASGFQLVYLMSSAFTRQVLIATIISLPLAWYGMSQWLNGFAYHINIEWTIFLGAFLAVLVVAWITVSVESIKAATTNPVNSLRNN